MTRYLLIIAILLTGCYTRPVAVRQHGKAAATYPDIAADYCARVYPAETKVVKGDSVFVTDTVWGAGEVLIDTIYVAGKPTEVTKTIILPGKVITNTILRTDTIYKENTAALDLCRINERAAVEALNNAQARADKYQDRSRKYLWILIAIGGVTLIWLFFKLKSKK